MKHIPIKYQVTFGLICLLVSIMSLAAATGIAPDERAAVMRGRGQLCSALAINSSILLNKQEHKTLEQSLKAVVERDDTILSAALRTRRGRIEVSSGDHDSNWVADKSQSVETQIAVPLNLGKQIWGHLELCFTPTFADRPTAAWLSPKYLYLAVVSILCVIAFAYYLGKILKQLDPSKAVPRHVEDALNTLTEGLILTDAKGKMRLANDAFSTWIGCESRKLIGRDPTKLPWEHGNASGDTAWDQAASNTSSIVMPWDKALRSRSPIAGSLLRLPDQNGRMMTLIANSSPIIGAKGDYVGVLTSFEDVTNLENHKVALSKAKENADEANRAKSDFLARMSHEIRTPMNAILGYAEVLRENLEEDPAARQQHLVTIHNSGEHLLALINDILDLSKIESGQLNLERVPVSIFNVINDVESVLKMKAQEKGIYLRCEYESAMPEAITTDSVRLRQLIINLIGNAIKFTEQGGVTVRVGLVRAANKNTMLLAIRVIDTGIGMSQHAKDAIFQPFAQADTSITRRFGGTGLGLAICKELAEKMGGSISVDSEPGKGSTFNLLINIGDISGVDLISERDAQQKRLKKSSTDRVIELPPMNVLIVDDGQTNRQLVSVYLRKANVTFDTAENGKEAVDKVNAGSFDAVLMDMQMPIMDGFEATKLLRKQGHRVPIIALTANAMAEDQKKCLNAGCSGFLAKPINRDRLLRELSIAVSGKIITKAAPQPLAKPETETQPIRQPSPSLVSFSETVITTATPEPLAQPGTETLPIPQPQPSPVGFSGQLTAESAPQPLAESGTATLPIPQPSRFAVSDKVIAETAPQPIATPVTETIPVQKSPPRVEIATEKRIPADTALTEPITAAPTAEASVEMIGSSLPMDDEDFVYVAQLFVDSLNTKVQSMVEALVSKDFEELYELGHWLKGAGGSAGYEQLGDPGMALEVAAAEQNVASCLNSIREICELASRVHVDSRIEQTASMNQ